MTIPTSLYSTASIGNLRDRTEYEAWLLEAVYKVTDMSLEFKDVDALIYPPNGRPPALTIYGIESANIGDWRPGFLKAGAPLVFVTAFKLLDMLLEWVLIENGEAPTYKFAKKIDSLKGTIIFPPLIDTRSWLKERIISLYEQLEPLRGTVIHDRHFTSTKGTLEVSSSRGGVIGPKVILNTTDLRNLSLLLVSILRLLDDTWKMDLFQEKRIRRTLDELAFIHRLPSLSQLPPALLNVRIYVLEEDPIKVDLTRIRQDILNTRPRHEVMFRLRIIVISQNVAQATAYLVPWEQIPNTVRVFTAKLEDLAPFKVHLPDDLDLDEIAREMI